MLKMTAEMQPVTLGFDGIVPEPEDDASSPTEYDVQFAPAPSGSESGTPKAEQSEEIGLLEEGRAQDSRSPTEEEKVGSGWCQETCIW